MAWEQIESVRKSGEDLYVATIDTPSDQSEYVPSAGMTYEEMAGLDDSPPPYRVGHVYRHATGLYVVTDRDGDRMAMVKLPPRITRPDADLSRQIEAEIGYAARSLRACRHHGLTLVSLAIGKPDEWADLASLPGWQPGPPTSYSDGAARPAYIWRLDA